MARTIPKGPRRATQAGRWLHQPRLRGRRQRRRKLQHDRGGLVGDDPFGGCNLSGTGPNAGEPHYLPRFTTEMTVTVNTRRRWRRCHAAVAGRELKGCGPGAPSGIVRAMDGAPEAYMDVFTAVPEGAPGPQPFTSFPSAGARPRTSSSDSTAGRRRARHRRCRSSGSASACRGHLRRALRPFRNQGRSTSFSRRCRG